MLALLERFCKYLTESNQVFRCPVTETQPYGICFTCSKGEMVVSCHLCPHVGGINGILFTVDDVVIDTIFDVGAGVWNVIEPFNIGFVFGEKQVRRPFAV